ncbi:DUF4817 domain-containing protein [Trichonephila clavipes]|nr:DUF4817 domain-containing protein [Trichonephila clavipes]
MWTTPELFRSPKFHTTLTDGFIAPTDWTCINSFTRWVFSGTWFRDYDSSSLAKSRILLSDEAHFWLNGYVNKQNCRIWSEANPQVYVETPLHPEKLTVWCALWAGGILLQKR